jgi:two-component system chemotaxis response regulator CheY
MKAKTNLLILLTPEVHFGLRLFTARINWQCNVNPTRISSQVSYVTRRSPIGMEASVSRGMRVLIADDQRSVGTSLADLVRCCNHDIVGVVGSGLEAIQAYARHHPDVVLMDYWMPKLNGATACRNIMAKDPYARVILVSGWSPSDDTSRSGAIAMLPKPLSLEQLNATLSSVAETLPTFAEAALFQE